MRKKRAIRNFAGIIFLCLVLIVFSVISFNVPDTDKTFVGFIRGINLGIEYQGGTTITYKAYSNSSNNGNSDNGLNVTANSLEQVLASYNYSANVFKTSNSSLKVQVSFNGIDDECENVTNILNLSSELKFKAKNDDTVFLTGSDIKNASALKNNGQYGVYIEFTKAGQDGFNQLTKKAIDNSSKTVELYLGVAEDAYTSFTISEEINQEAIFISGGINTMDNASKMAARINASRYNYSFEEVNRVTISQKMAKTNKILTLVVALVVLISIVVYLYVRFKNLGLCGVLSILIAFLAQILLLLSLPNVVLTPTSFVASVLTMVMGAIICSFMFGRMNKEYALGKKIHASVKFGFTKTYSKIIDVLVMTLVPMFLLLICGTEMAKQFAVASLIGIVVYGLSCLLLSYLFAKLYVDINPTKAKKYGFKREAHINEIA